jgi:tRNA wybutosine-synthesizing protein 1
MAGAPGVLPERLHEAYEIRHCALSLVGEPIMYPKINEFLDMLHDRDISSFLVTNAQFPEAIANLRPVCQLCKNRLRLEGVEPSSLLICRL